MTTWGTAIGGGLAVGLLAAFPLTLAALPDDPDLQVAVPGPHPYVVRDTAGGPIPPLKVLPIPEPDGLVLRGAGSGPGLDLRTWQVTDSHRWEREVTVPVLTGPFVREGDELCGITMTIGAGLFDTTGAGAGLQEILKRRVADSLPYTFVHPEYPQISITFPKPTTATMRIALVAGRLASFVQLVLEDGTQLGAFFAARLIERAGVPVLVRDGALFHDWRGPTYDALLRQAASVGADVGVERHPIVSFLFEDFVRSEGAREGRERAQTEGHAAADRKLTELVDAGLAEISLGLGHLQGPHYPIPKNKSASVRLRLEGPPAVSSKGIQLRLCASVTVGTKVDPGVPGSVAHSLGSRFPTIMPEGDDSIAVVADGSVINHALYFAWQSGVMRDLGTSRSVVSEAAEAATDETTRENLLSKLAFEFTGFDPGVPPAVLPTLVSSAALPFTLGDVRVGDWGSRRVVAHVGGRFSLEGRNDAVRLISTLDTVSADCTERVGDETRVTPCMSDLMPTVRERLATKRLTKDFSGADLLSRLPTMSFGGGEVRLFDLTATSATGPVRVNLRVRARVGAL